MAKNYSHQIGADAVGNQLFISVEKTKKEKKVDIYEPPCDCPPLDKKTKTESRKKTSRLTYDPDDEIEFRVNSKLVIGKKDELIGKNGRVLGDFKIVGYKMGYCENDPNSCDHCENITVYPKFEVAMKESMQAKHMIDRDKEIYLLNAKKTASIPGAKHKNIEIEYHVPIPTVSRPFAPPLLVPKSVKNVGCQRKIGRKKRKMRKC